MLPILIIGVVVAGAYVFYPEVVDDIIPHAESTLQEHCYFSGGPGTGMSFTERGQVVKIGCTDAVGSFKLEYIRLQGGYLISEPSGSLFIRLYTMDLSSGLPDVLLTETEIQMDDLDLAYNGNDWVPLFFDEHVELLLDNYYVISWVYPEYHPGVGIFNCHITTIGETSSYGCGDAVYRHPGESWGFLDCDFVFEVYGYI